MTDRNEALRLADELAGDQLYGLQRRCRDEAAALLRQQAERIAELEARVHTCGPTCSKAGCINRRLTAQREQLRAEVEQLRLAEEGAAQAFGDVVQQKRDLEAEVKRLQSLLDGAYASIRQHAARTTHKDEASA